ADLHGARTARGRRARRSRGSLFARRRDVRVSDREAAVHGGHTGWLDREGDDGRPEAAHRAESRNRAGTQRARAATPGTKAGRSAAKRGGVVRAASRAGVMADTSPRGLLKVLGVAFGTTIIVGNTIGAG